MADTMLKTGQVAKMLSVGTETVRRWIILGKIPHVRLPGRGIGKTEYRVPLSYVEGLIRTAYEERGFEYPGTEVPK